MSKKNLVKTYNQTIVKEQNMKKLSASKQNELNSLVDSLIKFGFQKSNTIADHWNQFLEMYMVLERIRKIEAELKLKINNSGKSRKAAIENFCIWAKEHGCDFRGVKITEYQGYDLGLEATKDFEKDDTLITVPKKLILSDECESSINEMLKEVPMIQNLSNIILSLILIVERFKPNSFWKPYLDILPDKYSTVLYFSPTDMQELKGTSAFLPAINQCKAIIRQYGFIKKFIQNKTTNVLKEIFTYDLYCWAVSTVMTRQNVIPGQKELRSVLIPFWDMANHMNGSITTGYNEELGQVESIALQDFKKGNQIFIHYGNRTNSDFLVHNGFVFPENKNKNIAIHLSLSTSDELFNARKALLDKLNIPVSGEFIIANTPNYISPELLGFARVFNMTEDQLNNWCSTDDKINDLLDLNCTLDDASLHTKTWNFLSARFSLLLKSFSTSLEEDEAMLVNQSNKGQKIGHIKSMLVQFRICEKRTLIDVLEFAKAHVKI